MALNRRCSLWCAAQPQHEQKDLETRGGWPLENHVRNAPLIALRNPFARICRAALYVFKTSFEGHKLRNGLPAWTLNPIALEPLVPNVISGVLNMYRRGGVF